MGNSINICRYLEARKSGKVEGDENRLMSELLDDWSPFFLRFTDEEFVKLLQKKYPDLSLEDASKKLGLGPRLDGGDISSSNMFRLLYMNAHPNYGHSHQFGSVKFDAYLDPNTKKALLDYKEKVVEPFCEKFTSGKKLIHGGSLVYSSVKSSGVDVGSYSEDDDWSIPVRQTEDHNFRRMEGDHFRVHLDGRYAEGLINFFIKEHLSSPERRHKRGDELFSLNFAREEDPKLITMMELLGIDVAQFQKAKKEWSQNKASLESLASSEARIKINSFKHLEDELAYRKEERKGLWSTMLNDALKDSAFLYRHVAYKEVLAEIMIDAQDGESELMQRFMWAIQDINLLREEKEAWEKMSLVERADKVYVRLLWITVLSVAIERMGKVGESAKQEKIFSNSSFDLLYSWQLEIAKKEEAAQAGK